LQIGLVLDKVYIIFAQYAIIKQTHKKTSI